MKTVNTLKQQQAGFTLIELMIVVAIVAILAAIALPAYQTYTQKARFTEVVSATGPFKTAVEICALTDNTLASCDAPASGSSTGGLPAAATTSGNVASVTVANGVITATGTAAVGGFTYTLTPPTTPVTGNLVWTPGGTCAGAGIC